MHPRSLLYTLIVIMGLSILSAPGYASFKSEFPQKTQRCWIGPEYWANPMEDWRINDGRLECISNFSNRNVHLLTQELISGGESFEISVKTGLLDQGQKTGSVGFRIAIQDEVDDYRSRLFHGWGIDAGIKTDGQLYIKNKSVELDQKPSLKNILLTLRGEASDQKYSLTLTVTDLSNQKVVGKITNQNFSPDQISGNIAIVNNHWLDGAKYASVYRNKNVKGPRFWFKDWKVEGAKISSNENRVFGPILWSMYSLSRNVMKMTALLPPIGNEDNQTVQLQLRKGGAWKTIAEEDVDPNAYTATFRITSWDDNVDEQYRLLYNLKTANGTSKPYYWSGLIRRDPKDSNVLSVAAYCCQTDYGFPHLDMIRNSTIQNPDLLFFAGDQIYEGVGGYGIIRTPADRAILNYLRKFYMFGWAFRDLMKDRPTLCIPDDHDVFQGNLWGNGGNSISVKDHDSGGYIEPVEMVNVVHRTNASHHPDAYDPTPIQQNMTVYYGDMVYGRVSFAILADRMFKSGPKFTVTDWEGRPDHVKDPEYDVQSLDKPGLVLLGERQLKFLDDWGQDWRGADMKCVLSQTIFCNVATHHGGNLKMVLIADLDANGWPQTGRNKALAAMRKSYAVHVAGDQHVPSLLQHGINEFRDAVWSFCVPAISVGYPRSWWPDRMNKPVKNRPAHNLPNTGDYLDGLENMISVYAIGNPKEDLCKETRVCTLQDKSSGYGITRFNKESREITFEAYRLVFDASDPSPDDQFPGWPKTVSMLENYGREAKAWLPTLEISGAVDPVVQIINEENNEVVYTLRIKGNKFSPKVFQEGAYTIKISQPSSDLKKEFKGIKSLATKNAKTLRISF
jgi:alkaline phosphatase D